MGRSSCSRAGWAPSTSARCGPGSGSPVPPSTPSSAAHRTPLEIVVTGARGALDPWWDRYAATEWPRARALLEQLGCGALIERTYSSLSSGERQRTLIARALMPDPDLLVLDEPFAGLDIAGREDLIAALTGLALGDRPAAIVLVVHHLEEIPPGFDHALLLSGGRVIASGEIDAVVASTPMSQAYGRRLDVARDEERWTVRRSRPPALFDP